MLSVSRTSGNVVNFKSNESPTQTFSKSPAMTSMMDKVEFNQSQKSEPPKISRLRLMFGILKDEQVAAINKAGKLPENAKFISNGLGGYCVANNFFNLRTGTRDIPAGFEVRKSIFGIATVLPKGSKGVFLKDK